MNRSLKLLTDWLLYALFSLAGVLIRSLSIEQTYRLAQRIGGWLYHTLKLRRSLTERNLRNAFPELSESELQRIARGAYDTQVINLFEMLRLPLIKTVEDAKKIFVEVQSAEAEQKCFQQGKGCVFVSAHFGNWELMGVCAGMIWRPATIITKAQSNKFIDRKINLWRTRFGNTLTEMAQSPRVILRDLKQGKLVAILADQAGSEEGHYLTFLGQDASVFLGAAYFALRTATPMFLGMAVRTGTGTYRMEFTEIPTADLTFTPRHIELLAARYIAAIETYIRAYPSLWLWLHNRWKYQKPALRAAALHITVEEH
ncbi:MAG: lysophospholipid acyltransferase family protein [Rhizobacter sp.]|nr:lysophospholipid acyltransferase family protein [Chlorobiales bacterium]